MLKEKEKKQNLLKSLLATIGQNKVCDSLAGINKAFDILEKEILEEIENLIKRRLDYCQKQNGLPYCKNCGLNLDDLKSLK